MSQTLVITDQLFEHLDQVARTQGLRSVEEVLGKMSGSPPEIDRDKAMAHVRALRQRLQAKYAEMPDSTDLIRKDRCR